MYFLWQVHPYSNKNIVPNSTIPYESVGTIFIQSTTASLAYIMPEGWEQALPGNTPNCFAVKHMIKGQLLCDSERRLCPGFLFQAQHKALPRESLCKDPGREG